MSSFRDDGRTPAGAVVGAVVGAPPGTADPGVAAGAVVGAAGVAPGAAWTSGRRAGDPVGGIGSSVVPGGGGGLISGIATAVKARHPDARVYACEPARFDDTTRSLAAGKRLENSGNEKSILSVPSYMYGPVPIRNLP